MTAVVGKVREIAHLVDAVNVTDCPMANVRMGSIAAACLIHQATGVETIFHLTCRDRNVIGLQADLLGAAGLGVTNILALTGDPPAEGKEGAKGVFDLDAPGLVRVVSTLRGGRTVSGREIDRPVEFCVAVAANPGARDLPREIDRLAEKVAAGADFVQTQPVFELETVERFEDSLRTGGIRTPVLYGILPLWNPDLAQRVARIPGINVPAVVLERVMNGGEEEGYHLAGELVASLYKRVRGIHVFPMGRPAVVSRLLSPQR